MYKGGSKLLPIALVIIVTIVAIIALVSVGKALLNRGDRGEIVEETPQASNLLASEVDRSVRMTVRGPIVADEEFHSYQIEVSPVGRRMTTFRGYQHEIIDTVQLSNTTAGYEEFVHALERVNFTKEQQLAEGMTDVRGVCAGGRLYTFELLQAQSVRQETWVASCREPQGSFGGEAVMARDLFLRQIPESRSLLRGLSL